MGRVQTSVHERRDGLRQCRGRHRPRGQCVASLIGALGRSAQPGTPGAPVDLPGGFGGLLEFGDHLWRWPPTAWAASCASPRASTPGRCGHRLHGDERQRPVVRGGRTHGLRGLHRGAQTRSRGARPSAPASPKRAAAPASPLPEGKRRACPASSRKSTSLAPPLATWAVTKPSPVNTCRPATC